MEIKCRQCGEFFFPHDDALDLIEEGYIDAATCNICDDCWELNQLCEYDYEQFSDADPGL